MMWFNAETQRFELKLIPVADDVPHFLSENENRTDFRNVVILV
jgi:hypothetical protein